MVSYFKSLSYFKILRYLKRQIVTPIDQMYSNLLLFQNVLLVNLAMPNYYA